MKSFILFAITMITFWSVKATAQESIVASTSDQSLNFILVGKVEKKMPYNEAWIKVVNTNNNSSKNNLANFRQNKIEIRSNHNQSTQGYDNYLYTMDRYQVDCGAQKFRIIESDDYDAKGKLLSKEKTPDAEWVPVVDGTIHQNIARAACK